MGNLCTSKANRAVYKQSKQHNINKNNGSRSNYYDVSKGQISFQVNRDSRYNHLMFLDCDEELDTIDEEPIDHIDNYNDDISITKNIINNDLDEEYDKYINDTDLYIQKTPTTITIGDEIELSIKYQNRRGMVRFIGQIKDNNSIFYGIELTKPMEKFTNNGSIDNICYFKTDNNRGLFVELCDIHRVITVNYKNPRIGINDEIDIEKYQCKGIIKCIGRKHWDDTNIDSIYYKIKLNEQNQNVILSDSDLGQFIGSSKYNLLIRRYVQFECDCMMYIPNDVIDVIKSYYNITEIRLTSYYEDNVRQYELFDISDNIIGPTIKCTQYDNLYETVIGGCYLFSKRKWIETAYHLYIHKEEIKITKLIHDKDPDKNEVILRYIKGDNEIPQLIDWKSIGQPVRVNFNDLFIHKCNDIQILDEIRQLYGLTREELCEKFTNNNIRLHGLKY